MKALVVSLESFQKGDVPEEVKEFVMTNGGDIFTILDESSKIKTNSPCAENRKSKRTQAIKKLARFGQRCILTGTFMSKSPCNAYDQMNFLCPDFFPENMYEFSEKYEIKQKMLSANRDAGNRRAQMVRFLISEKSWNDIGARLRAAKERGAANYAIAKEMLSKQYGIPMYKLECIAQSKEYAPFYNIGELWNRIGDNVLKVRREDLLDLPPKLYKTINAPLTTEQKKLYLQLQKERCTENIAIDNALSLYVRFQDICNGYEPVDNEEEDTVELKPLAENPKLDVLEEVVEQLGNEQVVIWCSRSKLLYDAYNRLVKNGYICGVYDGKIGHAQRDLYYKAFTEKRIQVLFVNQASGAYGLDGLKEANYAVYLCNSYSVEQRQQSEDRIYRGQVKSNKYIIDITCNGTCEDRVVKALKEGKELLDSGCVPVEVFKLEE